MPGQVVADTEIARELGIDAIERVRDYLVALERQRWVEGEPTHVRYRVRLTPAGHQVLQDAGLPSSNSSMGERNA